MLETIKGKQLYVYIIAFQKFVKIRESSLELMAAICVRALLL